MALAGCGDISGPTDNYRGTWHLRTINAQPLPFDDGSGYVNLWETLTIQKNGSFEEKDSSTLNGQPLVQSHQGFCTLKAPTQLICDVAPDYGYGFVWQGDSLYTAVPSGFLFVFKR